MNTYLVPTTAAYCYEPYDHIFMVYAESAKEAYTNTYTKLQGQNIPLKQDSYESPQIHFMNPENMIYLEQHSKIRRGWNIWHTSM